MKTITLIQRIIDRETYPIYISTVRKLERAAYRRGHLAVNPYYDEWKKPEWQQIRTHYGVELFRRVVRSTLEMRGWPANVFHLNTRHSIAHLKVVFKDGHISPLELYVPLPVKKTPQWLPRHMGGVWSPFELGHGDMYRIITDALTTINQWIRDEVHGGAQLSDNVMDHGRVIRLTRHVCSILGIEHTPSPKIRKLVTTLE